MRIVGLLAVILLYLGGGIYAYDFQKCTVDIAYWYNYYYDPGALLKANFDSTAQPPTSDTTLASTQNRRDKDTIITPRPDSAGVPIIPEKSTDLPVTRIEYIDNDTLLYDDYLITVIEGIPYVEAQMSYEGDRSILESLGVRIFMQGSAGGYGVNFPLSILPQLDTMTSMILIESFPKLQDNYPMAVKVDKVAKTVAYDFQKCSPAVEYWYNYYYDPGALAKQGQNSVSLDSAIQKDSTAKEIQPSRDSSNAPNDSAGIAAGKSGIINDELPTAPSYIEGDFQKPYIIDSRDITLRDGIPYIFVFINYEGDLSDLHGLGVITYNYAEDRLYADVPLIVLPQVDSLESVTRITIPPKFETQELETGFLDRNLIGRSKPLRF